MTSLHPGIIAALQRPHAGQWLAMLASDASRLFNSLGRLPDCPSDAATQAAGPGVSRAGATPLEVATRPQERATAPTATFADSERAGDKS